MIHSVPGTRFLDTIFLYIFVDLRSKPNIDTDWKLEISWICFATNHPSCVKKSMMDELKFASRCFLGKT